MLYVAAACLLSWTIPRKAGRGWAVGALLLGAVLSSYLVVNDVRYAGVVRDDTDPSYSVVYFNSTALFPLVIQQHHNWTAGTFFYRVLLLDQDGRAVFQIGSYDQSEYMHYALFGVCITVCFMGFFGSLWLIVCAEFVWWWRKTPPAELAAPQSSGM